MASAKGDSKIGVAKATKKTSDGAGLRLPAGRHGLSREFVVQNQRERIVTALVDSVAARGYHATTVALITKGAAVSRRTFYQHFADKEACFLVAYETVAGHLVEAMTSAAGSHRDWPDQVRAALAAMLGFFAAEPELARLLMIEPPAAGGEVAARQRETLHDFAAMLCQGRPTTTGDRPLPAATEEALVGGVVSLLVREISAGRAESLGDLLPDLVELITVLYLGPEAAHLAREP